MKTTNVQLLTFLIALAVVGSDLAKAEPSEIKNVLMIAVDDLNDWITPLGGHPQAVTPNFERLAKMGVTFYNGQTAVASCHPARVANWTGVLGSRSGITTNRRGGQDKETGQPFWRENEELKDVVTLSQYFRDKGFTAHGGGKLYHAQQWDKKDNGMDMDDWDSYFPSLEVPMGDWPRPEINYRAKERTINLMPKGPIKYMNWEALSVPVEEIGDHQVVSNTIEELERTDRDKPFFIACGIYRPHIPWEVPQEFFDLYPPAEDIILPPMDPEVLRDARVHNRRSWHQWVMNNFQWKRAVRGYLASVSEADYQLGRLLDAYEETGRDQDTVIILWSDHGMHIGEKQNWEKFTVWEESTRIPMFAVVPGVTQPGSVCEVPVTSLDFYPTLVELFGDDPKSGIFKSQLDGESLVPLLEDPTDSEETRQQPGITSYGMMHSVRTANWRYIFNNNKKQPEELYDHENDPSETVNLAYDPDYRDILDEHRELMTKWVKGAVAPEGDPIVPDTYELVEDGRRLSFKDFEVIETMIAHEFVGPLVKDESMSIVWQGPWVSKAEGMDPEKDYRLLVSFTPADGGDPVEVEGYFAGQGLDSGVADSGKFWAVDFVPEEAGAWTWSVDFRTGDDIANSDSPTAGRSYYFDGNEGEFEVSQ